MSKFLEFQGVEKAFPLGKGKEYVAVTDVNLEIKENQVELPVEESHGYTITGRRLEVTGVCPRCQKKLAKNKK